MEPWSPIEAAVIARELGCSCPASAAPGAPRLPPPRRRNCAVSTSLCHTLALQGAALQEGCEGAVE